MFITFILCPSPSHLSILLSPLLLLHVVAVLGWHVHVLTHWWLLHSRRRSLLYWLSILLCISSKLLFVVSKLLPVVVTLLYAILMLSKLLLGFPLPLLLGRLLVLGLPLVLTSASFSNSAGHDCLVDAALGTATWVILRCVEDVPHQWLGTLLAGMLDVASMSPTVAVVFIPLDWIGRRLLTVSIVVAAESVLIAIAVAAVTILVVVSIVVVAVLLATVVIAAPLLISLLRLIIEVARVEY